MRPGARAGRAACAAAATITAAVTLLIAATPVDAQLPGLSSADSALAREIFAELIEIPSVSGTPATREAAEAIAARLRAAGFAEGDMEFGGPEAGGNLIVRYRGSGEARPILLMAHLDVVPALRSDWSVDPFVFLERDGWYYGRGTTDNTAGVATLVTNLLRYKREGFVPRRDLVVILTGDEETSSGGVRWLVNERREWVEGVEFALNTDAGGGVEHDGVEESFGVQASEKMYLTFRLEATNPGGHSSRPRPDNAIYTLMRGLERVSRAVWPVQFNEITRAYFQRSADLQTDPRLAADMRAATDIPPDLAAIDRLAERPYFNALMRTTCVATRLEAGHADNALPQTARAIVNCRVLPGGSAGDVERDLIRILDEPEIRVSRVNVPTPSPPSPLTPEVMGVIERLAEEFWPGVPVIPSMSTGATDGLYVRNAGIPVYGVSAIFGDPNDSRAHGRDERIRARRFYEAVQYWYRLVKELSS